VLCQTYLKNRQIRLLFDDRKLMEKMHEQMMMRHMMGGPTMGGEQKQP